MIITHVTTLIIYSTVLTNKRVTFFVQLYGSLYLFAKFFFFFFTCCKKLAADSHYNSGPQPKKFKVIARSDKSCTVGKSSPCMYFLYSGTFSLQSNTAYNEWNNPNYNSPKKKD